MNSKVSKSKIKRVFFIVGGVLCVGVGVAGLALPVMPGVPFLLGAVFCFSRGWPRVNDWLLRVPGVGPLFKKVSARSPRIDE